MHRSTSALTSLALAPPSLTMKLACVVDTRARPARASLSPARSTRAPGGPRNAVRHVVACRIGILKNAPGAGRFERLRSFAEGERLARRCPQGLRLPVSDLEVGRNHDLTRAMQPAVVVAELHRRHRHVVDRSVERQECDAIDELADQSSPEVRVAMDRPAYRPRRAGPRLETGDAMADRPAHQAVDCHAAIGTNRSSVDTSDVAAVDANDESPEARRQRSARSNHRRALSRPDRGHARSRWRR